MTSGRSSHTGRMCNSLQMRVLWLYGFADAYQLSQSVAYWWTLPLLYVGQFHLSFRVLGLFCCF